MSEITQDADETTAQFMARRNREATLKKYAEEDAHRNANSAHVAMAAAWKDGPRKRYVPYENPVLQNDSSGLGIAIVEIAVDVATSPISDTPSAPDFSGGGGDFSGGGASGSW
jgi:hypothetical protein